MIETIYVPMTKTYKVTNEDRSFNTYTPKQYKEKFGALPEEKEDVADTVEPVETPEGPVAGTDLQEGQAVKVEDGVATPALPTEEEQDEIDGMVDYIITEETVNQFPALPDGTILEVGDRVSLEKNHPLLATETPTENKSILSSINPFN